MFYSVKKYGLDKSLEMYEEYVKNNHIIRIIEITTR